MGNGSLGRFDSAAEESSDGYGERFNRNTKAAVVIQGFDMGTVRRLRSISRLHFFADSTVRTP